MSERDDMAVPTERASDPQAVPGRASEPRDTPPAISGFDHSADLGKVHYGGQAVIEGVMMRGPSAVATAVRAPGGDIVVNRVDYESASRRHRFLRAPVLRGGLTLIESLSLGIKALNYSASVAMEEPSGQEDAGDAPAPGGDAADSADDDATGARVSERRSDWKTSATLTATLIFAFALGIVIFFWIPMVISGFLTDVLGSESGILFNVIDGIIRVVFFLAYIWGISRWKEMARVFEYHGAEHRIIFAQEAGLELTPENAKRFTTRHPRCGTSFLLIVMVVSILVFMIFGKPPTIGLRLARLLLIPVIAGISYEIMKLAAKNADRPWARALSAPGVWLQGITTKEPSDDQIEVAIAALEAVRIKSHDAGQAQVSPGQARGADEAPHPPGQSGPPLRPDPASAPWTETQGVDSPGPLPPGPSLPAESWRGPRSPWTEEAHTPAVTAQAEDPFAPALSGPRAPVWPKGCCRTARHPDRWPMIC